ncbi:reverse transcriptase [Phytophthora megakarya]|uniref:Reverse transcriptase n=1 Tax=Phytophthora megakarya TaxID=4795 RepID=A0A225W9I9_9STRA|nr:reverse transcriptase [Phytophthora megakarya]
MASGFWAIKMSERAKLISAFVCPFGHFQWTRMPFGLKNAPLIYQSVINNCLWGFVRLPPEEEAEVDQDVLDFLGLNPTDNQESERSCLNDEVKGLTDLMTVFQRNIPMPSHRSYINDIAHGAKTWDQLCEDLDTLLYRLRYWNISVSLPKSEFGKRSIPYLLHEIIAEGIRATPNVAKGVMDLPFPTSHKGVLSFLGSLNYYHKFIEDFPVVAAVLYELSEDQIRRGRDLSRAHESFELLKRKIVATPMLRHPDIQKPFVIIPHANRCAVVGQEHDGKIQPVRYTGRVLNDAELRYHIAEKEVIAILPALQAFRTILEGRRLIIYTRYSVLKWVLQSKSADGRCVPCGVTLSHWDIEIRKVQKDEDGLAAIMEAGITPREHLDEAVETLIPPKGHVRRPPVVSVEMLGCDFQGVVLSFDGAAKLSTKKGSCGCVLWQLPGWKVLKAKGFLLENVTVNDAEYHGLFKGLEMAIEMKLQDLVAVGDSRIVIQQVQGLINCNQPHLQTHLAKVEILKAKFGSLRLVHLKGEYNQAADYLTTKTLILDESWDVTDTAEIAHLEHVSKIAEKRMKVGDSEL